MLTGGNVAYCKAGEALPEQLPDTGLVNADKGYDSNAIRQQIGDRGAFANSPPKDNRIWNSALWPPHDGVRRARRLNLFHELAGFGGQVRAS
ncbi:hypothetical protein X729_30925 [Mesorhizobium sp. L103C131B0]|nr:hypothetical protein X729_30925 [Mesorhizobium sp. L103C131B0]